MPRSVREWVDDLQVTLRDTAGSLTIWSFDEKYRALQEGFRQARGHFRTPEVYDSLTLARDQLEYGLPPYVDHIRAIDRLVVTPLSASISPTWLPMRDWNFIPTEETNRIWFGMGYDGSRVRIYYERDVAIPPLEVSLWTNITSTQGFIPVANTTGFQRWRWPSPGYLFIGARDAADGQEVIRYDAVTASSFTGLMRGLYQTAPTWPTRLSAQTSSQAGGIGMTHSSNLAITPFITFQQADLEGYISDVAKQQLYLMRMGEMDTEGRQLVASLAQEYGRQAQEALQRSRPHHTPRMMQFRMPRRK